MGNDTNNDELNKTSPLSSKSSKTNYVVLVLTVLVCSLVFGAGGYYLGTKSSVNKQVTTKIPSPQNIVKEEVKKSNLPFPIVRVKKQVSYSDWTRYKYKSGYSFYYPNDWFISEEGLQVQNWDPKSPNLRPRPLSGEETKWDLSFNEQPLSSFEGVMTQADTSVSNWDSIEVSSTLKGWPVYFAYKEKTEPMGNPYLVAVVVTPENKILSWHGFSGDAKSVNIEKLKQIVESLQK
ncbi:hypothetical protein HYT74_01310 [Candidatus Daviesbacteria bacterium]|nr:hypothetical protein [Candidatus Daviesbacteria bacterium]